MVDIQLVERAGCIRKRRTGYIDELGRFCEDCSLGESTLTCVVGQILQQLMQNCSDTQHLNLFPNISNIHLLLNVNKFSYYSYYSQSSIRQGGFDIHWGSVGSVPPPDKDVHDLTPSINSI
jgi:hypothetical protein